jgi:hypothetical protein
VRSRMERIDVGYGAQERFLLEIICAVDVAGLYEILLISPCKCCASPPHVSNRYWPDNWAASPLRFGAHVSDLLSKIDEPGNGHEQRAPNAPMHTVS